MLDQSQFSVKPSTFKDLFPTEIPAGNDTSRDPESGLGTMCPESINLESISGLGIPNSHRGVLVPAQISIVNISSSSQNLYMKWRILYDLFFCLIKYPQCLVRKFFWKTETFIWSGPTLFSKRHIFQMLPWWLFERSPGQRNRRPESCENHLGLKYPGKVNTERVKSQWIPKIECPEWFYLNKSLWHFRHVKWPECKKLRAFRRNHDMWFDPKERIEALKANPRQ
jgi:hypothetical protein